MMTLLPLLKAREFMGSSLKVVLKHLASHNQKTQRYRGKTAHVQTMPIQENFWFCSSLEFKFKCAGTHKNLINKSCHDSYATRL